MHFRCVHTHVFIVRPPQMPMCMSLCAPVRAHTHMHKEMGFVAVWLIWFSHMKFKEKYLFIWRRTWQPAPVFLPEEFHGQRSLVGYSPWGHTESDMTETT